MLSSLFTGVSGLKANGMAMAVIGDNIANVNTIAFKANSATFANVLRRSLAGATGNEIGNGVHLWGLSPLWAQGSLETTSNSTDMAIDGRGFFMVRHENGDVFYTRAGVFSFDADGDLVNPNGLVVQGYKYVDGKLQADVVDISIPSGNIPPKATTMMSMNINLDSRALPAQSGLTPAVCTVQCTADNSGILYTAVEAGESGNGISIEYVDSGSGGPSVMVSGDAITVDLGGVAPTASEIIALINGDADASALVTAAAAPDQDGTGQVEVTAALSLEGGSGQDAEEAVLTVEAGDSGILYTAVEAGESGNGISIEYVDSGSGGLSVTVSGDAITVDLGGATATANEIIALIDGDTDASALVTAAVAEGYVGDEQAGLFAASSLSGGIDGAEGIPADSYSTTLTVYDSLGSPLNLTIDFTCLGDNQWQWRAVSSDGTCTSGGTIAFDASGKLVSPAEDPTITISGLTNGASDININWDLTENENFTGYSLRSMTTFQNQDGYSSGTVQSVSVDRNGVVSGIYSNGQMWPIYQIALADFPSYAGLDAVGENLYGESFTSGQPTIGIAGSGTIGNISPNSLEMSNVDLANEFVKMITTQRAYQANARVITTSDEILSELMNVKR
ncbi:putative Flagellar hook-basal body protein [uncultured Desulfatiglans sp.]|uniref:Flagellar hook protein FlgE n=1 Tax=Uncultured Desulfatiglans sp. TaxID=1748965 RepID=A0A653A361_UNCDX|nr:putative Flagellar hook-basal body protein [uncultured Desulfatiglans sp.]